MLRLPPALRDLPVGPPLHLEVPGNARAWLGPFLLPERIARMEAALHARTDRISVVLEHLHDPHNIGACVRTLDALGVQDLCVIRAEADPPEPGQRPEPLKIGREVSRGSEKWLDLDVYAESGPALAALKERGVAIAVTDIHGDGPVHGPLDVPLDRPLAVIFGNEHEGVSEAARAAADYRLLLPMHGFVESLNVSVAMALIMGRLRERVDVSLDLAQRSLAPERRVRILDRWICNDVPHLRAILRELQARHPDGLPAVD